MIDPLTLPWPFRYGFRKTLLHDGRSLRFTQNPSMDDALIWYRCQSPSPAEIYIHSRLLRTGYCKIKCPLCPYTLCALYSTTSKSWAARTSEEPGYYQQHSSSYTVERHVPRCTAPQSPLGPSMENLRMRGAFAMLCPRSFRERDRSDGRCGVCLLRSTLCNLMRRLLGDSRSDARAQCQYGPF